MHSAGQLVFVFGGILSLGGMIALFRHVRLCKRIIAATADWPDGLRWSEAWLNIDQFRKRRKLNSIVATETADPELRSWASEALRLEVAFYCLLVPGMILMAVAAAMQG